MLIDLAAELVRFQIPLRGIIQIGAHEGQEIEQFARMGFKEIHAVEANPAVFSRLSEIAGAIDGLTHSCVAISDQSGDAHLNITSFDQSSSLLDLKYHQAIFPGITVKDTISVETRTLDDHLNREGLRAGVYNVLAMDTQGSELRILRGAERYLDTCDAVMTEVNLAELYEGCPEVEEIDAFLFDRGFVRVQTRLWSRHWGDAFYVRSERITRPFEIFNAHRGSVQIPDFVRNGRFANQLFQFAFIYFYALRAGAKIRLPQWPEGRHFEIPDYPPLENLPTVQFKNANRDPLLFFGLASAPRDIGFSGYFQDLPIVTGRHRTLFRRLLTFRADIQEKLERFTAAVTREGTRPILALHVRRGDYFAVDPLTHRHARVPTDWYVSALRAKLARQPDAYVHVATDDRTEIAPILRAIGRDDQEHYPCDLPDHLRDFHMLKSADVVLLCNSSFSHMAALLAHADQKALLVNFATGGFDPYDAWTDEAFWIRYMPHGDPARMSIFDQRSNATEISEEAAKLVAAADRIWQAKNRFRLWRLTTGTLWAILFLKKIQKRLPRRFRKEYLSSAAYRQIYAVVSEYWANVRRGELPKTLPRWRFLNND